MAEIVTTSIKSLPLVYRGKVRDSYAVGDDKLLIVASDRISAFDVILGDPIPKKGKILTALTDFWFKELDGIVPNHLTGIDPESVVAPEERDQVKGRAVVAKRLKPILVECVARGYLSGSAWKEYQTTGQICGVKLPAGLKQSEKLPEPIFTPAGKLKPAITTKTSLMKMSSNSTAKTPLPSSVTTHWLFTRKPLNMPPPRASSSPTPSLNSVWTTTAQSF